MDAHHCGDTLSVHVDPPARGQAADGRVLRAISPEDCMDLLEPGGIGRVGFSSGAAVMMLPVTFALQNRTIVFRTAPDTLLASHANGVVSFQADQYDQALREGWSVLIQGHARKVATEREVRQIEGQTGLEPWAPGARDVYVRVTPARISGRRIQSFLEVSPDR